MKPLNKTASILGLGQIGGSLGLALKKNNYFTRLYGYDPNMDRLKLAEVFLDDCFDSEKKAIDPCDVVIVAAPINKTLRILQLGFEHFPEKFYTDVGSTKMPMLKLAKNYKNIRYIGGHPLAGSEKEGESGWDANLFKGNPYFYIYDKNQYKDDERLLIGMIQATGAIPFPVSAERHDQAVALTSHLPLLLSLALISLFSDKKEQLTPFSGSGFKSMTRLSGGSAEMGKDLLISNRDNILAELENLAEKLSDLKGLLETKDETALLQKMKRYQELYWKNIA